MASWISPTVARRWLAYELRRLRDESGLNQKDVAKECGWSGARLSYIEHGQQNVADDDLSQLLPLYSVPEAEWPGYYEAAESAREKGWWEKHDDQRTAPDWFTRFVGLEQGASLIRTVEPYIVPGLLQTHDYIVASLANDVLPRTPQQIARIATIRVERQRVLTAAEPARFDAVIDESVLRRVVGGPAVMVAQLDHITSLAERPNIRIRVFPFTRGPNQGMVGGYRILHFPGSQPPLVYMEYREGATYLEDVPQVDEHLLAFDHVARSALTPSESIALVERTADEYRRAVVGAPGGGAATARSR